MLIEGTPDIILLWAGTAAAIVGTIGIGPSVLRALGIGGEKFEPSPKTKEAIEKAEVISKNLGGFNSRHTPS